MRITLICLTCLWLGACTVAKRIDRSAKENVLNENALKSAHVGISIFEPATGNWWYNYGGDKYFVPASNTKLATCYAAMKYLGDSLVGLRSYKKENHVFIDGTGDPTFLHTGFKVQPVLKYFQSLSNTNLFVWFNTKIHSPFFWGSGWSWSDFEADYMAERSAFPIYGNTVSFNGQFNSINIFPKRFESYVVQNFSMPNGFISDIKREIHTNEFKTFAYGPINKTIKIPFITSDTLWFSLLMDTLRNPKNFIRPNTAPPVFFDNKKYVIETIHSQPTDSLLKSMMHRSDNFFAEQALLMVSNEYLGFMNDEKIIDTLLKTDFNDLPQKPRWADGSGLSRYNLFSPQDFVFILHKMKREFGMPRIKNILATGGEGTLSNYYQKDSSFIFAKTGSLSGVVALSGFLYTKKGKELIFSVLVNNHQGSATAVRRAVEKFINWLREQY